MQSGFTFIELVVVVCTVAMLAATVLPRLVHMQRETRIDKLKGLRGSVISGATLAHALMLRQHGMPDAAPCPNGGGAIADNQLVGAGTVCTDAGLVHTVNGYPAAQEQGIVLAASIGGHLKPGSRDLAGHGYLVTHNSGSTTTARLDAASPPNCSFSYTEPAMTYTAPTFAPLVTSGC